MLKVCPESEVVSISVATRSSKRERKRKRRYSDYTSDDSAVEADYLDSGSEGDFSSYPNGSGRKRLKLKWSSIKCNQKLLVAKVDEESGSSADDVPSEIRDGEKLLMRQWIQKQADDQTIPGLYYLDQDKKLIRIPWKHGSRTGWTIEDCRVYKAWATHTGKIGCITEPKKWKANFRCALNSLPDVREMSHLCQKKGTDPFKVYLLLPEVPRKSLSKKTRRCKLEKIDESEDADMSGVSFKKTEVKCERTHSIQEEKRETSAFGTKETLLAANNISCFKSEEHDTETKFSHSLIPTVVEELSDEPNADTAVLANLKSVELTTTTQVQAVVPESPQSSSPLSFTSGSSVSDDYSFMTEGSLEELLQCELQSEELHLFLDTGDNILFTENDDLLFSPEIPLNWC